MIEGLEITTLAAEGKAMGKHDNQVVFVPMAVPGDVVDVQIRKHHRRFMEGSVVRFVKKSELRVDHFCEHFGVCGGCKWQNLPYEEQLKQKTKQVEDQLVRIGHLDIPEVRPCLGSERTREYRNKLEFTFADKRWLTYEEIAEGGDIAAAPAVGFHIPGCFDKVLDINKCHLQIDLSNRIRLAIKEFCIENGYSFHNARAHEGLMRTLVVRTASTGEVMVIVVFNEDDKERISALMNHLQSNFPEITSLFYVVNTKWNDSVGDLEHIFNVALLSHLQTSFPEITSLIYMINEKWNDSLGDREPHCFAGKDHIIEEMEGLKFKVGPKSFYQTNSEQAYELYKITRDFADLQPTDVLYDLYTGTGTIANFCARRAQKVVGVEYVPEAIEDAKINSQINGIENTVFYAGDMKDVMSDEFISRNGRPDVIILDPPRAGVDERVLDVIKRAAPERMVYVSCNPSTQARDLALLSDMYEILAVQPVDMFPHTHHVENVVKLRKK